MARRIFGSALVIGSLAALALTGCSTGATEEPEPTPETDNAAFSQEAHDLLPEHVVEAGELKTVGIIFPPYAYYLDDGATVEGLDLDVAEALSDALGIEVSFEIAPSITEVYSGLASGRYDVGVTPGADTLELQKTYDFVDWLHEYVVFAVPKGNPAEVSSLETTCGATIATLQGGSAERVLNEQKPKCLEAGDGELTVNTYPDQATAILAVQSGRADAAFSSQIPLTYFVDNSDGALELAGENQENGFPNLLVGAYSMKGNGVAEAVLAAMQSMRDSGAYDEILEKYSLSGNAIEELGINLVKP